MSACFVPAPLLCAPTKCSAPVLDGIGFRLNLSGCFVQHFQMNSYGIRYFECLETAGEVVRIDEVGEALTQLIVIVMAKVSNCHKSQHFGPPWPSVRLAGATRVRKNRDTCASNGHWH